jgi:hypothetical protein
MRTKSQCEQEPSRVLYLLQQAQEIVMLMMKSLESSLVFDENAFFWDSDSESRENIVEQKELFGSHKLCKLCIWDKRASDG